MNNSRRPLSSTILRLPCGQFNWEDKENVQCIKNNYNAGVGAALNQGFSHAIKMRYEWAITFDQDTWVRSDLLAVLADIYKSQSRPELVGHRLQL